MSDDEGYDWEEEEDEEDDEEDESEEDIDELVDFSEGPGGARGGGEGGGGGLGVSSWAGAVGGTGHRRGAASFKSLTPDEISKMMFQIIHEVNSVFQVSGLAPDLLYCTGR